MSAARLMPFVPACELFTRKRDGIIEAAASHCPHPGIARDLYDESATVECLGLFTTDDAARPVVVLRIVRPVKLPRVVALSVTVGKDRRTPLVRELDRIEWVRWCGLFDGTPGTLHGDRPADYDGRRSAGEVEYLE